MANPTVVIEGRLAADPELKSLATGNLLKFRVITNDRTQTSSGEWVDKDVSGWNVEAWSKVADSASGVLEKGMSVIIVGTQRQRSYETTTGEKRTVTEIKANNIAVSTYSLSKSNSRTNVTDMQNDDIWATPSKSFADVPF